MKYLARMTAAALLVAAAPVAAGQAAAATKTMQGGAMSGDPMHSMAGDAMHQDMMAPMHMSCKMAGSAADGMMVEFHNMGKGEIPAGTKVHWMMRGMAQGDATFKDAMAPGGMMSQNYTMGDSTHMSGDAMHMAAPCTVKMM